MRYLQLEYQEGEATTDAAVAETVLPSAGNEAESTKEDLIDHAPLGSHGVKLRTSPVDGPSCSPREHYFCLGLFFVLFGPGFVCSASNYCGRSLGTSPGGRGRWPPAPPPSSVCWDPARSLPRRADGFSELAAWFPPSRSPGEENRNPDCWCGPTPKFPPVICSACPDIASAAGFSGASGVGGNVERRFRPPALGMDGTYKSFITRGSLVILAIGLVGLGLGLFVAPDAPQGTFVASPRPQGGVLLARIWRQKKRIWL